MRNRIDTTSTANDFWPPRRSNLARRLLGPVCGVIMRRLHQIDHVAFEGLHHLDGIAPRDGVLICPNHSYTGDASIIVQLALKNLAKPLHFMAAEHVFARKRVVGWMVQRLGGFSVDREGCDRRAIRTAIELLAGGKGLIVFPEGEIYHLNERLTPLRDGVAFMATSAQRDLAKAGSDARVWIVPSAIRYEFIDPDAVRRNIEAKMADLERPMMLKPAKDKPLHERVLRLGEVLLTIQEKQHLGRSYDDEDEPLAGRLRRLTNALLERLEREHFDGKTRPAEDVPVRVKLLRQHLIDKLCEVLPPLPPGEARVEGGAERQDALTPMSDRTHPHPDPLPMGEGTRHGILAALDDVHRVLQYYSYPGDYLLSNPTLERLAETVEKFQEDVTDGYVPPLGRRRARMTLGAPIDVQAQLAAGRKSRAAMGELTAKLEAAISGLINAISHTR